MICFLVSGIKFKFHFGGPGDIPASVCLPQLNPYLLPDDHSAFPVHLSLRWKGILNTHLSLGLWIRLMMPPGWPLLAQLSRWCSSVLGLGQLAVSIHLGLQPRYPSLPPQSFIP